MSIDWKTVALSVIAAALVAILVILAFDAGRGETRIVVEAQPTQTVCEQARAELLRVAAGHIDSTADEQDYREWADAQSC